MTPPLFFACTATALFIQTFRPSPQVCSNRGLFFSPHLPSQDPPVPQQLNPVFVGTHLGHSADDETPEEWVNGEVYGFDWWDYEKKELVCARMFCSVAPWVFSVYFHTLTRLCDCNIQYQQRIALNLSIHYYLPIIEYALRCSLQYHTDQAQAVLYRSAVLS